MPKKVPHKNISKKISDVRWPEKSLVAANMAKESMPPIKEDSTAKFFASQPFDDALEAKAPMVSLKKSILRRFVIGLLILAILVGGIFAFNLYRLREKVGALALSGAKSIASIVIDLKSFRSEDAQNKISNLNNDLNSVKNDPTAKLLFLINQGGDLFKGFQGLTGDVLALTEETGKLETLFFDFIAHHRGDEMLASLQKINSLLTDINNSSGNISNAATAIKGNTSLDAGSYIPFQSKLHQLNDFLTAFVSWLKSPGEHHVLVLLGNPSEIRPGGGFLGSYADVVLEGGNIKTIDVHDINDPDKTLQNKIVPPLPLQALVPRWRAADSNWFFGFSDSAAKTIKFLESSDLYKKQGVTFDGAIAISPKVIRDLLALTGPVQLTQSKITLNQKNFLVEIQKKVQAGQETQATYPKGVLSEAAPLIFDKLGALDEKDRSQIFDLMMNWVDEKDLMVYFKNSDLQKFFETINAAGNEYKLPLDFNGDYLAVVDANIGGGKTDLYMKEGVLLQSQVGADGMLTDHLEITRTHQGNLASYWWYKVLNQDYLQVFTPPGVRITNFKGGMKKTITPPANYKKDSYEYDSDILAVESSTQTVFEYPTLQTHTEYEKNVFSTWSRLGVGETAKIVFDYERRLSAQPQSGETYEFVFDKQAGTDREYHFEINAPLGFRWQENNLSVYEYQSSDPLGRVDIKLTLEKI